MKKPILYKKRGKAWYYRRAGELTFHSTGARTRGAAENYVKEHPEEETSAPALEGFAAGFFRWGSPWIKRQHAKGRSFGKAQAQNRQNHLDRYILPQFGKTALSDISKPDIEDWLISLPLANSTRNAIMYTLRIVLREAKARRLIADNPLQEPEPLGKTGKSKDVFSLAELRLLFPAKLADVWFSQMKGTLFMVLASTGIRSGECRALAWRQVLWTDRALLVDRCVNKAGEIAPISAKKGGSKIVLLPSRTLSELRVWHDQSLWREPEDLVFSGETRGHTLGSAAVTHALAPAIRRVNAAARKASLPLPLDVGGRALSVHSFRHGFNTAMRRLVPEETLRLIMGHHSERMTDLYDHPELKAQLEALEPARDAIETAFQ